MTDPNGLQAREHSHVFGQDRKRDGERRTLIVVLITAAMMVVEIVARGRSAAVGRVKEALKGTDSAEIKNSSEDLTKIWSEIAPSLYQQGAPGAEGGPQAGPQGERSE